MSGTRTWTRSSSSKSLRRFSALLTVAILSAVAMLGAAASSVAQASPDAVTAATFTVSSTVGWQETPIHLTADDTYSLTYESGTWTVDYRNFPYVGPGGYSNSVDKKIYQGCKYDPKVNYAVLLGVVGDSATAFPIRTGGTFTADSTGPLYLRINDDDACLGDNAGSVKMYVNRFQPLADGSASIYAGYSLHPSRGVVSGAIAQWRVPAVSCASSSFSEKSQVAVWVALWGGPNNATGTFGSKTWLPQAGVLAQCRRIGPISHSVYEAVYQMYNVKHANGFTSLFGVHANDTMLAQVEYVGAGTGTHKGELEFWYDVTDMSTGSQSQNYFYTAKGVAPSDAAYQGGVIVERVGKDKKTGISGDLPKFPPISISGAGVGQNSPITNEWTGFRWDMKGYAKTGPLITSPTRGDGFSVTWEKA
jgi:Peptidase A4 family